MDMKIIVFLFTVSFLCGDAFDGPYQGSCKLALDPDCDCRIYHFFCSQSSSNTPYHILARQFCSTHFDNLVRIESAQEQDAIVKFIKDNNLNDKDCIPEKGFWIGLDDRVKEGDFVWLERPLRQGLCPQSYKNWAPDEPNNNTKQHPFGQDCGQLWFRDDNDGKWDDEYCNFRPKGAVCEERVPHCNYAEYGIDVSQIPDC
ncbi:C-type lectin mosGCTL-1-like [Glandiceps talaboti]